MINIVFVIDTIESPYAGTEKQLLEILGRLDRTRFRPHLVCLRNSDWLKTGDVDCEITVMELGSFFSFEFFRCRRRFARFCREQKVDIVQTFFRDGNLAGTLWAHKARVGVIIVSRRNIGSGYWHNRREIAILRYLKRYTTHYVTNSDAAAEETSRVEGVESSRITVIGNGLDIDTYPLPDSQQAAEIKRSWGFADDTPMIGAVANLRPVKNLPFLVRAAARIVRQRPGVGFVALGEGDQRTELQKMIDENDLTDKFVLPGRSDNVARDLAGIDIAVLCSHRESLSNSLMEYMATGRALIASDVGGNRELISSDDLGFIYPADDEVAFDRCVLRLLDDDGLRDRIGQAARAEASRRFSFDTVMGQLETLYESLVTDHRRGQVS